MESTALENNVLSSELGNFPDPCGDGQALVWAMNYIPKL